jgi:hypothetical protein
MSEDFSGFMPMIHQINITKETPMINTEGELVTAHTFKIQTKDGSEHIFSISNQDLMRLYFLISKVFMSE